uniref:RNA 2'-phosphotransferase n=1 Tax=Desulfobacca acetoxidans TaxID=60893 RepID=A0A7C5AKU8_9BACT
MIRLTREQESLARILAYILCHRPDEFGLVLDEEGFVPVRQLLQVLAGEPGYSWVRRRHLEELAHLVSPPRFELLQDRLRGLVPGPARLRRPGVEPPPLLYLALPPKAHAGVFESGLKSHPGRELLLAATPERALNLGRRRSPDPVLVTVQAGRAHRAGVVFQGYGEGLFLAERIPREYLQLAPPPVKGEKAKPRKPSPTQTLPGAVLLDLAQFLEKPGPLRGKDRKGEPSWKAGTRALRRERRKPPK